MKKKVYCPRFLTGTEFNWISNVEEVYCPEKADKLLSIIEKTHKFDEIYISEVGPVMGTYTSQGAVLAAVL